MANRKVRAELEIDGKDNTSPLPLYDLGDYQIYYSHQIWESGDDPIDIDKKNGNAHGN